MREIYTVNATQCVISDAHPEGLYSVIEGYPKNYDSRNYPIAGDPNGDMGKALAAAKSDYYDRLGALYAGATSRMLWTVTLTQSDGRSLLRESVGLFPDMAAPAPEGET